MSTKNGSLQVVVWSRTTKKQKQSIKSNTFTVYGWRRAKLFNFLKTVTAAHDSTIGITSGKRHKPITEKHPNPLIEAGSRKE